jgi:sugar phosphate isomerase/epimerase
VNRRHFLTRAAAGAASIAAQTIAAQSTRSRIDRSRISAISDEVSMSPEEAIAFAHHFGLHWLELRDVPALPGQQKPFFFLPDAELRWHAKLFRDGGIRISFINTNLLKKGLPGTVLLSNKDQTPENLARREAAAQDEYDHRFDNLTKCIQSAHAVDCQYLRVFSFLRVEHPAEVYERVADIIGEMAHKAQAERVMLLIENEPSCNVGNSAELAAFLPKVPASLLGFNWDARNALSTHEVPFPDGYRLLPKGRMRNAQIKGHDMLDTEQPIDWAPIFAAMDDDGYPGQIGLETHYFDGTKLERSHLAMDKIVKLADANALRT